MTADSDPDSTSTNRSGGVDISGAPSIAGDVVGRDKNIFTGDQQYDVRGLANPYLGLKSFTYADCAKYAGREKLIAETVVILRRESGSSPIAITTASQRGGDFGRTTLVFALCHNKCIHAAYPDGVLWIVVGEKPDLISLLVEQIKLLSDEPITVGDINAARAPSRPAHRLPDARCPGRRLAR